MPHPKECRETLLEGIVEATGGQPEVQRSWPPRPSFPRRPKPYLTPGHGSHLAGMLLAHALLYDTLPPGLRSERRNPITCSFLSRRSFSSLISTLPLNVPSIRAVPGICLSGSWYAPTCPRLPHGPYTSRPSSRSPRQCPTQGSSLGDCWTLCYPDGRY